MVSIMSILGIICSLLLSFGLPIGLLLWLKKKTGKGVFAAAIGAVCFVVFALVLEQILHMLVIPLMINSAWMYGIYGCLAAGVFEETGRLVGLRFLCKKDSSLATGLGYGIGHGGIEAILLAGVSNIVNLVLMLQINSGALTAGQLGGLYEKIATIPSDMYWASGIERVSAILVHISLSVLIYLVVTKRLPFVFYFVSIVLHALVNVGAVLYQVGVIQNVWLVEGTIFLAAVLVSLLVAKIYWGTKPKQAIEGEADA